MKLYAHYNEKAHMVERFGLELSPSEFQSLRDAVMFLSECMDDVPFPAPEKYKRIKDIHNHIEAAVSAAERQGINLKETCIARNFSTC